MEKINIIMDFQGKSPEQIQDCISETKVQVEEVMSLLLNYKTHLRSLSFTMGQRNIDICSDRVYTAIENVKSLLDYSEDIVVAIENTLLRVKIVCYEKQNERKLLDEELQKVISDHTEEIVSLVSDHPYRDGDFLSIKAKVLIDLRDFITLGYMLKEEVKELINLKFLEETEKKLIKLL